MENTPNKARLKDLAQRSFENNQYTFTGFLNMNEVSEYYEISRELEYASPTVYGGHEMAERNVVRFGNPDEFGYEEEFPISILEISPLLAKFSDDLNHRDFLGAIMNLGIERDTFGDILVEQNRAYVFCLDKMADYICENLTRIKHTSVKVCKVDEIVEDEGQKFREKMIQVASERIDAIVAKTFDISRTVSTAMFAKGLIFVNGCLCSENAKTLKDADVVSVRGYGRFIYAGRVNTSRKGKENCLVKIMR